MSILNLFSSAPTATTSLLSIVNEHKERKERAELRLRFYHDRQTQDLFDQLKMRWARPEDFRLFFINVVRKITDKRAMVYAATPYREFADMDQAAGEALYASMNANVLLKKANRLTKLCKTTALQIGWHNDHPTLSVITPNILDAVHDGYPEEPTRLIVTKHHKRTEETTYSDWTATTFQRCDYRGQYIPMPDNPDGVNPYGILPFVPLFDSAPDDRFFLHGGEDLVEAQRAINVALTNLWRAIELQSHGQAWASGLPVGDVVRAGPDRTIALPENGEFGFAAPNTPIADVLQAIEFLVKQTAVANDLAANVFELDPKAESGAAKYAESRDLMEARADDIELWRNYEAKLFEVVKRVANTHAPGTVPENATVSVDFGEVNQGTDENTRLDVYKKRIDLGIWSPVDALMDDNPDIRSREQAMEVLGKRALEKDSLAYVPDNYDEMMAASGVRSQQFDTTDTEQ